jgi:hypothetical protein
MAMRSALFVVCLSLAARNAHAQQIRLCADAERFLSGELQMAVKTEPDTISDFRTGGKHAGCRVTAASLTSTGLADEAVRFYERVRQAGWVRTPDPWDSPRESSLRFRKNGSDCLFNLYEGALLLTAAEREVSIARTPGSGQSRYGVFVMCVPVLPAKPRGSPGAADQHQRSLSVGSPRVTAVAK